MSDQLTTGIKITVDTSDLDVKFLKCVDELNAGLTKTQKALHLTYDESGLLTNAFGQCVEGLSISQIKLGEYVDELGRVRTIQGGFTEGLNKSQIAMGQYADELGRVYNKTGELIGHTAQATKKLEQQAKEAAQANKELKQSQDGFSGTALSANAAAQAIGGISDALLGSGNAISETTNLLSSLGTKFLELGENFEKLKKSKKVLSDLPQIAQSAGKQLGVLKNAIGAIGSTTLAALTALAVFSVALKGAQKYSEYLRDVPESFEDIARNAWRAHEQIKTLGDALKFGAFAQNSRSEVVEALDELERLTKTNLTKMEQDEVDAFKARKTIIGNFLAWYSENTSKYLDHPLELFGIDHTREEQQEAMAKVNEYLEGIKEARKTEEDKLNEKISDLKHILENESITSEQRNDIENEIDRTKKEIADKNKDDFAKKYGLSFEKEQSAVEYYKEALTEFADKIKNGIIDETERSRAEKQLAEHYIERAVILRLVLKHVVRYNAIEKRRKAASIGV